MSELPVTTITAVRVEAVCPLCGGATGKVRLLPGWATATTCESCGERISVCAPKLRDRLKQP